MTKPRGHLREMGLLLLFAALWVSPVRAQWESESPLPTFLDIRGVAALDNSHVLVATSDDSFDDGGALFETLDGGVTWQQRDVPFSLGSPLNGIFFRDAQLGWVYGNENYRTTDGGASWVELPILGSIYRMEFPTSSFGFAWGGGAFRYVTQDGGDSWVESPSGMFDFDFADSQSGLGVAASGTYRTTDGGDTFAQVVAGEATSVAYLTPSDALSIVDDSFRRSTDGGATWVTGEGAEGRTKLHVLSSTVALAWGRSGTFPDFDDRVFRSADAGATWSDLGEVMPEGVFEFAFPGGASVVGADIRGNMFYSDDLGLTWSESYSSPGPFPSFLSSASPTFANDQVGYFGFGSGFVIRTLDGGASWEQISSGAGQSLRSVDRFDNGDMIAVGDAGTMLVRRIPAAAGTNAPWVLESAMTANSLEAVQVVGGSQVVAVDETGRLFRSDDAGSTWTSGVSTPAGLDAVDLDFSTLLDGWVIGTGFGEAALFHTTDGGDSWAGVPDFLGGYTAVDFEGESGWAANVGGVFYRTIDAGETWVEEQLPGSPLSIQDMDFFDVAVGYVAGRWGYVARTDDGGQTWDVLPTPNNSDLFTDIYLLGPNEIWLSTANGLAYYSANGGQNWAPISIGSGDGSHSAIVATAEGSAWVVGVRGSIERFDGPPPPPLNRPPEASFEFQATGLSVDFTDLSIDPDGLIVSWAWEFGDGDVSAVPNPSHTYNEADTYTVRLTVTDEDDDTGSTIRFVVAQPSPGGTFGDFTEVTPTDPFFVTPQDEDFWVATTAPADYDGDGDLDVAVLGFYVVYNQSVEERLVLLRNEGLAESGEWDFSYIDVPLDGLSSGASDLAWGDVDGDGDEDLLVATDGVSVIFRNDGAGGLEPTDTELPGYLEDNDQADFDLQSVTWADYDNDSDLDLLIPSVYVDSTFSYRTALLRNDGPNETGGWIFSEVGAELAPTSHAQSVWADYDGDLDLDLLLVNLAPLTDEGFIRRYRNDGDGNFVGEDILGALTVEHGEVQWGDYDEDGDLDILVAGHVKELDGSFARVLRIYQNDSESGTYDPIDIVECIPCEGWFDLTAATWADYDSDGDVDVLLTGTYNSGSQIDGRAKIYSNEAGVFTDSGNDLPAPRSSGTRGGTFSWLDIDGEGDLDYLIAGSYFVPGGNGLVEAQMHLYRNDVAGQNGRPTAPGNLATAVVEESPSAYTVSFSWSPASDDQTSPVALTYDLHVFDASELPAAIQRIPEPGNVSASAEWTLSGISAGDYRWTLRAVDSAFHNSPVAEGVFTAGSAASTGEDGVLSSHPHLSSFPNPSSGAVAFRLHLPLTTEVHFAIYDVRGRRVATLLDGMQTAGSHELLWEAREVASGTYFARMVTPEDSMTQQVRLLR